MPKQENQRLRLARLSARARRRYWRRHAAVAWFWAYWRTKWERLPHLGAKITVYFARLTPQLVSSPRRNGWISYEDCLHVADQALLLYVRLDRLTTDQST